MSLNHKLCLYYLAARFNLQKSLSGSQCVAEWWVEKHCQPLSSCHNTMKHRSSVCPENKLSEQEKTLVSGSNLCKSLVCFPFHVGTTSFTFALLFRKFMVFFPHWISNCRGTQQPLYLISAAADGSGLWQLHFPWRSMAAYADHRWLWIFDAAVFFSFEAHNLHGAHLGCFVYRDLQNRMKVWERVPWSYITELLVWLKEQQKKKRNKSASSIAVYRRRIQQTSVNCGGTSLKEVRPGFIERHGLILNLLLLRASASSQPPYLCKKIKGNGSDKDFHAGSEETTHHLVSEGPT